MKKFKRFLIIAVTALIALAMLSSVAFIAAEADHECSGEDCAVCCAISACVNILKSFSAALAVAAAGAFAFSALTDAVIHYESARFVRTPVALKTKLLN